MQLGVNVLSVTKDDQNKKWILNAIGADGSYNLLSFDKVVVASGTNNTPIVPVLKGQELYKGRILHSQGFKRLVFTTAFIGWISTLIR